MAAFDIYSLYAFTGDFEPDLVYKLSVSQGLLKANNNDLKTASVDIALAFIVDF